MAYSDIVATIAMIVAIIAVPASGYLSYHYAIKGEKRKEFNILAEPVIIELEIVKKIWSKYSTLSRDALPYDNIDSIIRRESLRKRIILASALDNYYMNRDKIRNLKAGDDVEGLFIDGVKSIDNLIKILTLR